MFYYHFTSSTLRDGSPIPPIGKWLVYNGKPVICESGLHASIHPFDALRYAPGAMLHRVELGEIFDSEVDKVVSDKRKIVASIDATSLMREFARQCAKDVLHLWNAPNAVIQYLNGDESLRTAAWDAAWAAARAARGAARGARDAAWDAAWAARHATWDAAWDAAWAAAAAARGAARGAARAAALESQRNLFARMVDDAFSRQP